MSSKENIGYVIPYINVPKVTKSNLEMQIDEPLLTRTLIFISEGNWEKADEYAERFLDISPENAIVYLCKLMIEYKVKLAGQLFWCGNQIYASLNYQKFIKFADKPLKIFLANEAMNVLLKRTLKVEVANSEYKELIDKVEATLTEIKNIRAYYDKLTQTQGEYLNNTLYAHSECFTLLTLVQFRIAFSPYTVEKSAIQDIIGYAKYREKSFPHEVFSELIFLHSSLLFVKRDYYGYCDILTFLPDNAQNAELIQNQARSIFEKLPNNHKISAENLREYKSMAIAQMIRFPIKDQKTADLILKSLSTFVLRENLILSAVKRLAEYNTSTENLYTILLENANMLPNGKLKNECLEYAKELQETIERKKEREKQIQLSIEKKEKRAHSIEIISFIAVIVSTIGGVIMGFCTIMGEIYNYEFHPWSLVFLVTLLIMTIGAYNAGSYQKLAVIIAVVGVAFQYFAWFHWNCEMWFFGDPDWITCMGDFMIDFLPSFLYATFGGIGILCITAKIWLKNN